MGKYLEAIAELEGGEDAVDIHSIQSVIKKVMEFCGKENEEDELTKEEFIAWFVIYLYNTNERSLYLSRLV